MCPSRALAPPIVQASPRALFARSRRSVASSAGAPWTPVRQGSSAFRSPMLALSGVATTRAATSSPEHPSSASRTRHVGSPARRAPATACALRALQACGGNVDCASAARSAAGRCSFRTDVSVPWLDACQGADHTANIVRVPGVSAGTDAVTALPRTAHSRPSQAANCDAGPVSARAATTAAR